MKKTIWQIQWTKTTSTAHSPPLPDGNTWEDINRAYKHLECFTNGGWEGYVKEIEQ